MLKDRIKKIFWALIYFSGINFIYNKINSRKLFLIGGHSVSSGNNIYKNLSIDKGFLEKQIKYLLKQKYVFLNFEKIDKSRKLPKKSVVMYFDDGFRDIYTNAYPIFKKYNLPFVLFVTTNFINQKQLYLSWEEIRKMMDLVEIGSHGVTHRDFIDLSDNELRKELVESKEKIKKETGQEPIALSFPHGKYNQKIKDLVQETGYKFAVITKQGEANLKDKLELKKIVIYPTDNMMMFKLKLGIFYKIYENFKKNW